MQSRKEGMYCGPRYKFRIRKMEGPLRLSFSTHGSYFTSTKRVPAIIQRNANFSRKHATDMVSNFSLGLIVDVREVI